MDRDRWTDERVDDLADMVRALAPVAAQVAVLSARVEDYDEDLGEKLDGHAKALGSRLDAIVVQTTATNGRLRAVERWVAFAQGAVGLAVTGAMVAGALKLIG